MVDAQVQPLNQGRDLSPLVCARSQISSWNVERLRRTNASSANKAPRPRSTAVCTRYGCRLSRCKAGIHRRDGRDVLISERFRNFVEESKFLRVEDKHIIEELRRNPDQFTKWARARSSPNLLSGVWPKAGLQICRKSKKKAKGSLVKIILLCDMRDLLNDPFTEMTRLWKFLGVKKIDGELAEKIKAEMESNPDEEWQAQRDEGIASFLPKGQAGIGRNCSPHRINPSLRRSRARPCSGGIMQWSKMSVREGNILEGSCSSRLERAESFLIYFTRICYALCSFITEG